jgi:hypothetical protein
MARPGGSLVALDNAEGPGARRGRVKRLAAVLLVLVAACGGGSDPATPDEVSAELECASFDEKETEELYVRSLYDCDDTSVYFFNDNAARDDWWGIAKDVGGVELKRGDGWIQVKA